MAIFIRQSIRVASMKGKTKLNAAHLTVELRTLQIAPGNEFRQEFQQSDVDVKIDEYFRSSSPEKELRPFIEDSFILMNPALYLGHHCARYSSNVSLLK